MIKDLKKPLVVSACLLVSLSCGGNLAFAKFKLETPKGKNTVEPSQANFLTGQQAMKMGDYDSAIDAFLQAIYFARNNYNPQAYFELGQCYKQKKMDMKAIEAYKKCVEQTMGPNSVAHTELAEVLIRNDRFDEADKELAMALSDVNGPSPKVYFLYGQMMEKQNYADSAMSNYLHALGDKPWTYVEAWMALTWLYMRQHQWSQAAVNYNQMLEREGDLRAKGLNLEEVLINLGIANVSKGNHQGAMECWKKALAVNPESAQAHLNLAKLFELESHISSAVNEYRSYIRLALPDDKELPKAKDKLVALEQQLRGPETPQTYNPPYRGQPSGTGPIGDGSELPAGSGF